MNPTRLLIAGYRKLPFYVVPYRLAVSRAFWRNYAFLKESEHWSPERMREWQYQQVRSVIEHAYDRVPFYRAAWDRIGFHKQDFRSLDDLARLPTISKEDIKRHRQDFVATGWNPRLLHRSHTGGSTSTPLEFFVDREQTATEMSFYYYYWEKFGYRIGDRCILLKGDKIARGGRHHRFDNKYNYMRLDSDYLNQAACTRYYDAVIRRFHARVLFGYPSSIGQLAHAYVRSGLRPPRFDLILLASENVYPEQADFIRDVFQAGRMLNHYGHSELVLLAWQYADNTRLGFVPQYGHVELLNPDGSRVAEGGGLGEIVGTGRGRGMPLIRYRTNDFAEPSRFQSSDFMRAYRSIDRVAGRLQEFVVTRDRRLVSICTIGGAHFQNLDKVRDMQFYQEKEGELILRVVVIENDSLTERERRAIENAVEEKLERQVEVTVHVVESIPRTARHKKIMIEQKLDVGRYGC